MIGTMMRTHIKKLNPIKINYRTYKYFDPCAFLEEIEHASLTSDNTNDPNEMFQHFSTNFETVLNKYAPMKTKFLRGNHKPFVSVALSKAIKTRSK